ncbi:hypothetical protein KR032_004476, partial [Drosophila birchii]
QTSFGESLAKLEGNLLAVQAKLEGQQTVLTKMENQLQAILIKMGIPPGFERIGNRYFRIVKEKETWIDAERKCREMGGYLALFESEEDLNAFDALKTDIRYRQLWLGINDQDKEGHYISVDSKKPATFLKWTWHGKPSIPNHSENCVVLFSGM